MRLLMFTLLSALLCVSLVGCGPAGGITQGEPLTEEEQAAAAEHEKQVEAEERAHFRNK